MASKLISDGGSYSGAPTTAAAFDPSYFQNLYSTTLNRAPETGALNYWADYANRFGLEAATNAFNYGAAQELAARTGSSGATPALAAPVVGPGSLPTPTAVVPTAGNATQIPGVAGLANNSYELGNLMRQYGVSSPTIVPNIAQVSEAPQTVQPNKQAYDKQAYQNYLNDYMTRLAQTNMYNKAQFYADPSKFNQQWSNVLGGPMFAPSNYEDVYNIYSKYFGRTPEEAGVRYWGNTGLTGDPIKQAITSGAQNADLTYFQQNFPNQQFARGGAVKTRYAEGGEVGPNTDAGNLPDEEFNRMFGNYVSSLPPQATTAAPAQAAPITATGSTRLAELMNQYARPSTDYARDLAEARRRSQSETEAFSNMIQQMSQRGESPTSRAEMYFRLASAFGSPTRTGMFTENLALAGKEMGEFAKGRRAEEAERRGLALKAQELRMAGAREDLATTRALAGQEAAERRAINSKVIEAYVRSGEPQSAAGKAAVDEGLRPGTPEYQARVQQLTDLNVSRMQELVNTQQENVRLRNEASQQLSAAEMNVLNDAMQNVSTARDNLASLRQALALNPNTAPSNLTQGTLNAVRRSLGSTSPTVVNTDELVNILSRLSLNSLKETFPGAISNDERRALQEVQGINAQNLESRRRIIERAITSLETMIPRTEARIAEIRSGAFGRRTPQETATPPGGAAAPGAVTSSSPGAVTSASPGAVAPEGGR